MQSSIQVLDAGRDVLQLVLVAALDLARLADDEIELHLDAAVGALRREPRGPAGGGRGREADLVVAGLVGREGEAARGGAALGDDAVVVVEDFFYGNVDGNPIVLLPGVHPVVILFGGVVSHDKRVLGQLLEEAFRRGPVDEEVESLCGGRQRQERQEGLHCVL